MAENPSIDAIDSNGNLCSEGGTTCTNGTKTYSWDAENRLVSVSQGGVTLASFTYNKDGIRTSKTVGGVTTTYVLEGGSVAEERSSMGGVTRHLRGPGIDNALATIDASSATWYNVRDHLGSLRQLTDASGQPTLTRDYDPWGNPLAGVMSGGDAFMGREWDPETALYYYRARYYDPSLARFGSEDVMGVADGQSLYLYPENSPVRLRDPSGRLGGEEAVLVIFVCDPEPFTKLLLAILAVVVVVVVVCCAVSKSKSGNRCMCIDETGVRFKGPGGGCSNDGECTAKCLARHPDLYVAGKCIPQ